MRNFSFFRIILILSFFLFSSSIYADSGIFQTYVIIDSGSGNQFYAGGINSDGAQVFNNSVLGTFDCESTLILNGGEVKTFKNNGSNVFGANIYYRIYSTSGSGGSFIQIPLPFNADLGNGDQKWQTSGHNVNMLSGLAAGTYNLEVYWDANTSDGTQFDSNNGTNFKATFTVEDNTPPPGQIQFAAPQLALDNVPEATQYNVVYELDIPTSSDWDVNSQIPYAVNNVSQLNGNPINRVAYLMQLDTKWVWVSYDAITQNYNEIGIPVDYQKQQVVSNMNVFASPNAGVTSGTNIQTGNIEFWSHCYGTQRGNNTIGGNPSTYDFNDFYTNPDCYGSFQIHNYGNAQTIFGFNRWSSLIQNGPSDLGIGNNSNFQNGPHTDWTYTINAGIYNVKKLYVLALNDDNVANPLEDVVAQCEVTALDAPTVIDNCAGEITGTTNTELPITTQGTTLVTWTFDDGSGNTSTQTQNIIIEDTEGPQLTCNDVTVYLDSNGNATLGANSVTDFSGTQGQGNWTYGQYFAFQAGNFELMPDYNVVNVFPGPDDAWNNAGNAFATPFLYDAGGHPGQDLKWAVRRWTSNMDGDIYISGDFFDVNTPGGDGANIRILKNGNQVLEYLNIPSVSEPYAITLPVVQGDVIDFAIDPKFDYFFDTTHFTADIAVVSATDNCGLDSISLSTTSFNCNNIGSNNNISIIAQDVNGNDSNCSFNVAVVDDIAPIGDLANLPDINEHCEVTVLTDPGVTDNCGSVTISNDATLPITTLGTTVVTWTYDDGNGNTSTQTQNVIIGGSTTLMNSTTNDGSFESNAVFSVNPSPTTLPPVWTINSSIAGMGGLLSNPPHTAVLAGADGNDAIFADNNGATPNTTTATSYDLLGGTYTSVTEGDVFTWSFIINSWSANSTGSLYLNFGSGDILAGTGIANDQDLATYNTISGTYAATAADAAGGQLNVAFSIGTGTGGTYGNVYGDNVQISVVKSQAPIITCPSDVTVNTDINSNTGIATYSLPTAFDTCDGALTVNQTAGFVSGSAFPLGTTVNTFEATDSSGNTSECSFTVTVVDNEDPTVTCPQGINVDATGANGAAVTWTGASAADNVGVVSFVSNFNSGDTFPIGQTTVTYTATDAANNTAACSFDVTVVGVTPDVVCPANITVENDASQCGAIVTFAATETVGIPASTISYSHASGSEFPVGTTTVTATATNAVGTSECTFTVTVTDNQNPNAIAKDITIQLDASGAASIAAGDVDNGSNDNCGNITLSIDQTNFDCDDIDTSGYAAAFTSGPDFIDMGNSTALKVSNAISIEAWIYPTGPGSLNTGGGIIVNKEGEYEIARFSDGTIQWAIANSNPGWVFINTGVIAPLNQWTHVAFTYNGSAARTFINGNLEHSISASGIINDVYPPDNNFRIGGRIPQQNQYFHGNIDEVRVWNIALSDSQVNSQYNQQLIGNEAGLKGYWSLDEGTGNTTLDKTSNGNNGTFVNQTSWTSPGALSADNTVTLTVIDSNGNSSKATATVTVEDNINPTLTCPDDIIGVVATSAAGAVVNYTTPVGTDNCSATTALTAGLASGATFPIGTTTVTYTVTDASNNTASCSFDVEVVGVSPDIKCPADIIVSNDAGQCGAIVTFAATETVGIPASTITYSYASGSEFPVGTTTVTATATNAVGTSECTFTVTVNDTEKPTIACAEDVTINNTPGECYGEEVLTPPTAADNCNLVTSNALDFDGVNDYVNTSIARPSLGNTWTMSAWIKYEGAPNATYQAVFGGNSTNFFIGKNSGNTSIGIQDGSYINNFGGNNAFDGAWHQIAVTRNNTVMSLYLDGQFITSRNYSTTGTGDIWIGLENQGNPRFAFNGRIDEVRIWNTVRTQTEIQANMNDELDSAAGLLASYHFNEGIAESNNTGVTIATDASGNGNNGTLTNFALTGTSSNWVEGNILTGPIISNDAPATFAIGDTTVTWTATDAAGNTAMCTQTVTVIDNEVPTITCPSDITNVVATGASGAVVTYTPPVGTDNCTGVNTALTAGFASGSTFPIGTTTVTYEVTDAANNKAECSFDVTVVGVTPDIVCPANVTVENGAGQCGAIVTFAATETVGIPASTITYSQDPGTVFPVGTTTVTAIATNAVGTSECTFTVTVNDTQNPTIDCAADVEINNTPGECYGEVILTPPSVNDNCSGLGNALNFDGIDDYVQLSGTWGGVTWPELTIEAWVYVDAITAGFQAIASSGSTNQFVHFQMHETSGINVAYATPNSVSLPIISQTPIQTWKHVALVAKSGNSKVYVNGSQVSGTTATNFVNLLPTSNLSIGRGYQGGRFMKGSIDELRIWNSARTQAEIAAKMNTTLLGSEAGLIAYYDFEDGPGSSTLTDKTGNGNHGTLVNMDIVNDWVSGNIVYPTLSNNAPTTFDIGATTVTWTATDAAGNTATCEQIVTVIDSEVPTITCPSDITDVVATSASGAVVNYTAPVGTDNCTGVNTALTAGFASGSTFPIGTTTVTYEVTDAANNKAECSFDVTVVGVIPDIVCPANITVENDAGQCGAIVTFAAATDAVGIPASTITYSHESGSEFPVGTTTVTATATNAVGTDSCTFTITVSDTEAPVLSGVPGDVNASCDAIPAAAVPTATDNCDNNVAIVLDAVSTQDPNAANIGHYNYTITRTWTATDVAGNQDVQSQVITVSDTEAPVLSGVPGDVNASCDAIPAAAVPTATDNCDNNVAIVLNAVSTQDPNAANIGHYNYTITRTWTATDVAGNQDVQSQVITVSDTEAPVLSGVPGDVNASCDAIPAAAVPTATDNCDNNVAIVLNAVSTQDPNAANIGHYNYTITRTWTATDVAGNQDVQSQVITVSDTEAPVLSGVPGDVNASCDAIPAAAVPTATDNCDNNVAIVLNAVSTQDPNAANIGHYNYTITRTWTATDVAGNQDVQSQVITVSDTEAPVLSGVPGDVNASCDAIPAAAVPTATDNCDNNVAIVLNAVSTQDPNAANIGHYNYTITRTWTATDVAGNQDVQSQVITVSDTEAPVLSGVPGDVNASCDAIPAAAVPTATDNCDNNVAIVLNAVSTQDPNAANIGHYNYTITRTWTATDVAGNQDVQSQVITVSDTEAPVLSGVPGDVNASCDAIPAAAVPTATDNCDNNVAIVLNAVSTQDPNAANIGHYNYTITRTWTATDVAGNQDVQSQVITVSDTEAPVLSGVPGDVNASCDAIPAAAVPTATDNCDNNVAIVLNAVSTQDPNAANIGHYNYTITRTWTATDVAGNQDVQSQVITVSDTEAPDLGCLDIELLFENGASSGSITEADILAFATDNCDDNLHVDISQFDFDCGDIGGDLDDLIISEYVDGSEVQEGLGYSKNCIEIYNGTGLPVNLRDYSLVIYADGSTTPTSTFPLGSTLANEDDDTGQTGVYTFCYTGFNEAPAQASAELDYDGNDAIALVKNGSQVDLIGIIGDNPGPNGWSNGTVSTGSKTLVRKKDALRGSTTNNTIDFLNQWTQYSEDTIMYLGSHEIEIEGFANNVTITVTDASGNSSTCVANVTVIELTPPTAIAQNVEVILDATGNGSTSAPLVDNGSSDNCGLGPLALDKETFTCADIATNPNMVTLTVTDVNGNSSTATAFVTVIDNLEPIVNTDDITIGLGADGTYTLSQANIDALSKINAAQDPTSDNCGIASVTVSPNTFSCSDVGSEGVEVTVTVTDVNNNVNTATETVFVKDTIDPEAICANITVTLGSTGEVTVTGENVGFGSTDSCGIATYEIKRAADGDESFADSITFYCEDEGANVVTIRVTDVNGNYDTCTANVTVDGDFPEVDITSNDLPEFCQGAVIVLTANSDLEVAYQWFFEGDAIANATEPSIEVDEDGEYTVIVTSATNCTAENNFTVSGFDKGGLLSAYTILATEEVFLIGSNLVESGGVGAMLPGSGNVKLHQASTVADFTQAATINLQQGSDGGEEILSPANPTLPDFQFNSVSNAGSPNAIVTGTQTLDGSVYNIVEVVEGAEVTFTAPNVFINELKTWKESAIEFTGCTNVLINERFQLAQNSTINLSTDSKVTFYVNDDVSIEKGSFVRASIYAFNHNITAKGLNGGKNKDPEPTFMTGLFIANRVQGNKNVVWNADDLCDSCPVTGPPSARTSEPKDVLLSEFDAKGWPSPSDTQFNIKVRTENKADIVTIEVFDMGNKLVHSKQFNHNDTYRFGEKLDGGVYIVKISQGGSLKILRLIKN